MEKKSTKIAYLVALAVFIVLLIVLGVTFKDAPLPSFDVDGEMVEAATPFAGTFWSLLPPIVAIVLALISKEVYSSLFLGCLVGALLVSNFHPWETVVQLVQGDNGIVTTVSDSGNIAIIVFLVILGIMVDLMNKAGGSEAFGRWATKTVKSRGGAYDHAAGCADLHRRLFQLPDRGCRYASRHRVPQDFPCQAGLCH